MAKPPLFTDGPANDMSYVNIRAAADAHMQKVRKNCEELWELFEPYADRQFLVEIRKNFDARYWEMYLTTFLIREGYDVCAPKPGPDVGIRYNGCRIWIEATCPERGASSNPDLVPELRATRVGEEPVFQEIPTERMLLRYLNSISEKQRQWDRWLADGVVAEEDTFLIAINPRRLQHEFVDGDPPRILQVAYPVGGPYMAIDPNANEAASIGYQYRDTIRRNPGFDGSFRKEITTGLFLSDEYTSVSGLLCSRIDAANQPEIMGHDFQIVENLKAKAPMPDMFRLKGTFFMVNATSDGYSAVPDNLGRSPRATIN